MRKAGWELSFCTWVERAQRRRFEWGQFDCALMAAECIEQITGTHPHPELVGSYYSPIGAARVLQARSGLSGIMDDLFSQVEVDYAQKGDIVLVLCRDSNRKQSLAICCGVQLLLMGQERPVLVNTDEVKKLKAWRIE